MIIFFLQSMHLWDQRRNAELIDLAWHKYVLYDILILRIYVGQVRITYRRLNNMKK